MTDPLGPGLSTALRLIGPSARSQSTQQTSGMVREAGVCPATTGSDGIWSGLVTTAPGVRSGKHHHGPAESAIYVVSGRARFSWGLDLEHAAIAEAGDFIYVPPFAAHAEENISADEPLVLVVSRNSGAMVTVNLDD